VQMRSLEYCAQKHAHTARKLDDFSGNLEVRVITAATTDDWDCATLWKEQLDSDTGLIL
jgi:hypothetical protein